MLREETYEDEKRIVVLLMALALAVGLIGCKDTLKSIVHKASGTSDEVQEEDTTRWADQTSDPLIIQGIADSSAKFATATADGCLYAVFNGIWSRQTSYFTVPSGTLSIMGCGTAEGTQRFKVAVWKRWTAAQICDRQHLLYPYRRHRLPLHHLRAGPGGAVPCDHLL